MCERIPSEFEFIKEQRYSSINNNNWRCLNGGYLTYAEGYNYFIF